MLENKQDLASQTIARYNQLIDDGIIDSSNDKLTADDDVMLYSRKGEMFAVFPNVKVNEKAAFLSFKLKDTEK